MDSVDRGGDGLSGGGTGGKRAFARRLQAYVNSTCTRASCTCTYIFYLDNYNLSFCFMDTQFEPPANAAISHCILLSRLSRPSVLKDFHAFQFYYCLPSFSSLDWRS